MTQSQSIQNLAKALMLFHLKMGKVVKSSTNPFFKSKYAGLPAVLDAIADPLQESNLTFTQFPNEDGLCTTLIHTESGEFMQSCFKMLPVKQDPQAQGSAITYARRYSLVSILGLNVDEDDDGNKASEPAKETDNRLWLNPNTKEWSGAIEFIKNGGDVSKIEVKYKLSKVNKDLLIKETSL